MTSTKSLLNEASVQSHFRELIEPEVCALQEQISLIYQEQTWSSLPERYDALYGHSAAYYYEGVTTTNEPFLILAIDEKHLYERISDELKTEAIPPLSSFLLPLKPTADQPDFKNDDELMAEINRLAKNGAITEMLTTPRMAWIKGKLYVLIGAFRNQKFNQRD